jgi:hypothetical protein
MKEFNPSNNTGQLSDWNASSAVARSMGRQRDIISITV